MNRWNLDWYEDLLGVSWLSAFTISLRCLKDAKVRYILKLWSLYDHFTVANDSDPAISMGICVVGMAV